MVNNSGEAEAEGEVVGVRQAAGAIGETEETRAADQCRIESPHLLRCLLALTSSICTPAMD